MFSICSVKSQADSLDLLKVEITENEQVQYQRVIFTSQIYFPEDNNKQIKKKYILRLSKGNLLWKTETCGELDPEPTEEPCDLHPETDQSSILSNCDIFT